LLGDCFAPRIALFFMRLLPVGQTQIQTAIHYHLQTVHVDVTSFLINMFSIETEVEIRITIINPQNPIL
jgi:hypothetical protein